MDHLIQDSLMLPQNLWNDHLMLKHEKHQFEELNNIILKYKRKIKGQLRLIKNHDFYSHVHQSIYMKEVYQLKIHFEILSK